MSKLDINTLLNNSLAKKMDKEAVVTESNTNANLALDLNQASKEETTSSDCPGCPGTSSNLNLALNLETVQEQEMIQNYIGEDVITNIKAAIGAGLGVTTVLEARANARYQAYQESVSASA